MIILSGVLVVLAIALLVTGIVTGNTGHEVLGLDGLKLIYVSIGVSIISALCLAIGVFLRRKELFGSAESQTPAKRSAATRSAKAARTKAKARVGAGDDATVTVPSATAAEVPAETTVFVVPGRKRYHLETCRQLAGREKEELTFVEAREEGFTACTACLPDTALAARAAHTETTATPTETMDAVPAPDSAEPVTADLDDDPAVTRMDLPIARVPTDTAPDLTGADLTDEQPAGIDEDAGYESPTASAASPAAAEPAEAEAPEAKDETPVADTAQFDAVSDAETASEPAAEERPLARSRSFFEPLDREETASAEEEHEDAAADDAPAAEEDAVETEAAADTAEEGATEEGATEEDAAEADTAETDEAADDASGADAEQAGSTEVEDDSAPADEAEDEADKPAEDDAAPAETSDAAQDDDTPDPDLPYVRILSGTKRYHRPDCALIEDIAEDADDLETLAAAEAKERGCTPCLVCQPDKSPSDRY